MIPEYYLTPAFFCYHGCDTIVRVGGTPAKGCLITLLYVHVPIDTYFLPPLPMHL